VILDIAVIAHGHKAMSGASTQHCLHLGSFDTSSAAATLSQLAGVLSGFAFFAVIYVLTNADRRSLRPNLSATLDRALLTLFCATFSLAITAIQYAILSGDRHTGLLYGRAASEELLADISLSLSIFALVAGILTLVALEEFGRTLRIVRGLATILGPPLAVYFVAETAREVATGIWAQHSGLILCGHNGFYSDIETWGHVVVPVLTLIASVAIWFGPPIARRHWSPARSDRAAAIIVAPPFITMLAVLASVSVGVSLETFNPMSHLAPTSVWLCLVATALLTLFQAFAIRFPLLVQKEPGGTGNATRWSSKDVRFKLR
jgi:hypothetical protein